MSEKSFPKKISLAQLQQVRKADWDGASEIPSAKAAVLTYQEAGFRYDLLWQPKEEARRLFVIFSGDALREKNDPPVFQRWSWASLFPGHCLFISDPSLFLNQNLGLAWYAGTATHDPNPVIGKLVTRIAEQFGIASTEVYFYGSSGGGFAALRLLLELPKAAALAINPQTNINAYRLSRVTQYYDVCFDGRPKWEMAKEFPRRISLIESADLLRGKRMLIAQNIRDEHHVRHHLGPFCAALGVTADHAPEDARLHRMLFDVEGGHKRAEDIETFRMILDIATKAI